jgi:hypothetical protein
MIYTKYDIYFNLKHRSAPAGSFDVVTDDLEQVFSGLYDNIAASHCEEPFFNQPPIDPATISEIVIRIVKKRCKG